MNDCLNHKKEVAGITDMKVLAEMIGGLRYDTQVELFKHLSEKYWNDRMKDEEIGHPKLAHCLLWIHYAIRKAWHGAERAWKISKQFME